MQKTFREISFLIWGKIGWKSPRKTVHAQEQFYSAAAGLFYFFVPTTFDPRSTAAN